MATNTNMPPAPSAAAPPRDIFEELVGSDVGPGVVDGLVLGPGVSEVGCVTDAGADVGVDVDVDVDADVAFAGEPGPHTGPLSAGLGKSFGMQLLAKPVKSGQFSLALLQHQSLPSK